MMKYLTIGLAILFDGAPAKGAEPPPGYDAASPTTFGMATEIYQLAALLGDDVLRNLVCRLSSERFTFGRLSAALGLPEGQVMRRIKTLRGWGLVRLVRHDSASTIVEPMPGDGARTLRRWAERYCPTGDSCGRPAANPDVGREARGRTANGPVGIASAGGVAPNLKGKLVTVFGGAGFVGRELAKHLVAAGARVRVASRNPEAVFLANSLVGDTPLKIMKVDAREPMDVEAAVEGADMVVNLISILVAKDDLEYIDTNEIVAYRIAKAAAAHKVERMVHTSTISASRKSRSSYSLSEAAGERVVRIKFPDATIVRPSIIMGTDGGFIRKVVDLSRHTPVLPLVRQGPPLFQPVYVGDVSAAIVRILSDPRTKGQTYDLGGPRKMTTRDIVTMVTQEARYKPDSSLPEWVEQARDALVLSLPKALQKPPEPTSPARNFVVGANSLGLADLGITATPIEDVVATYRARK